MKEKKRNIDILKRCLCLSIHQIMETWSPKDGDFPEHLMLGEGKAPATGAGCFLGKALTQL